MTEYITKKDKNGRDRYYRITDGKMKVISRAEYEANVNAETIAVEASVEETNDVTEEIIREAIKAPKDRIIETSGEIAAFNAENNSKSIAENALATVKSLIASTGSKHAGKIRLQRKKNCVLINYRNCMVCSLIFNGGETVKEIRFMETSLDSRKKNKGFNHEYRDLINFKDEIIKQAEFIDWWYQTTSKKAA